jgi:uncharacterized protein (DUF2225 family)
VPLRSDATENDANSIKLLLCQLASTSLRRPRVQWMRGFSITLPQARNRGFMRYGETHDPLTYEVLTCPERYFGTFSMNCLWCVAPD